MDKYILTDETMEYCGHTLYRIEALRDFGGILAGDKGGWIESAGNSSQCSDAWVSSDARVYDDAWVSGNAKIQSDDDWLSVTGLGSRNGTTTVCRCAEGGLWVTCGCFGGTLDDFAAKVKETHGDSKYAREYLALIDVIKIHFEIEEGNKDVRE